MFAIMFILFVIAISVVIIRLPYETPAPRYAAMTDLLEAIPLGLRRLRVASVTV
jgi:hypothetical protein